MRSCYPRAASGRTSMNKRSAAFSVIVSCMLCFPLPAQSADPLPRANPEDAGLSSQRLALIAKTVNAEIARDQLPGAVLAIARRGKLVYFETFGYRDKAAGASM